MPSIINSDNGVVSGTSGLKTTGGNDGITVFQQNGTESARIDSSGNVGIGTSSPGYRLHVANSSATSTTLLANILARLQSNASGADASLQFSDNVANSAGISLNQGNMTFSIAGGSAAQIDTSANLKFNSGYGSVATAYGCRAWVNFNGTSNTNLSGTYSQSGTTVTVTATAHGLIAGNTIYSDITTGTGVDGIYTVATVTDANTFTYTAGTSLTTSGNITLIRNTIRASGNVSSIADSGTGNYVINFATAMPDVNYCAQVTRTRAAGVSGMGGINILQGGVYSTTGIEVIAENTSGTDEDPLVVCVAIFR